MKNTQNVKNLRELLKVLQTQKTPTFINLCPRCGKDDNLMDSVVSNLQEVYGEKLDYQKLVGESASSMKQELMISKNPVLLLIKEGEIRAIFGGIIAQYKLEQALENLSTSTQ